MYGSIIFPLLFTFDDYQHEEPYLMLALLAVAAGAWFYLRGANPRRRALALFAGLTLAMAVAAAGKAILYAGPDWPRPRFFTWQTESMGTVIMWGWLVVALFVPVLLNYLPPSGLSLPADEKPPDEKRASWFAAAAGAAPFFAAGAMLILNKIPYDRSWIETVWNRFFWVIILLPLAGLAIGWAREFPAWSYPYVSLGLMFGPYLQHGATPGVQLFGLPIFGREVWGWRAWIPLAAGIAIALLISRSLRPAAQFFANIGRDWSLLTFAFYGAMPLLVFGAFDEMDRQYSLPFMILLAGVMVATPALYLRSVGAGRRALALLAGVVATVGVAVAGPAVYWHQKEYSFTGPVIAGSVWIAAVCFPLVVGWLNRAMAKRRAEAG